MCPCQHRSFCLGDSRVYVCHVSAHKLYAGDMLLGITLYTAAAAVESLLEMGYHYIMGRAGEDGSLAPPSRFYGGRSQRCCFSEPGESHYSRAARTHAH